MKTKFWYLTLVVILFFQFPAFSFGRTDSVDVLHYSISASIRNFSSKSISGVTRIKARVLFNSVKFVSLDLLKLTASSVSINSVSASFQQTDSTLTISSPVQLNLNDTVWIEVAYTGNPVQDARWGGFYFNGNYAYNMGVGMASYPHSFGRCWFPCIDNFTERATFEYHITTDSLFMAVCNGLPRPSVLNPDGSITWNWELHQSIPTYIANVAVSKYVLLHDTFPGINGLIPVILAVEPKDTANLKISFTRLKNAITCFEQKFGPYRFDRVGYVGVPFTSGAMEHAGNISYPLYAVSGTTDYETLFAHELSHHWWGNLATCRTSQDMWLNEGWASFCEALFLECAYGSEAYLNDIRSKLFESARFSYVRDGGYLPVSGVDPAHTYGTHVYTKGALMVHSIRSLMGDEQFFNACKQYLNNHAFSDVSTSDLLSELLKFQPDYLNEFFEKWILQPGEADLEIGSISFSVQGNLIVSAIQNVKHKPERLISFPVLISVYKSNGEILRDSAIFISDAGAYTGTISTKLKSAQTGNDFICILNEYPLVALGKTFSAEWIKSTGIKTYNQTLFSATVQSLTDSALLITEHHFTGPSVNYKNQVPAGIRVSSERYWTISGFLGSNFKSTAFFNYDGSMPSTKSGGFLDNELMESVSEDSLFLLYRPSSDSAFRIETDLTRQTGSSKSDKIGRFWVNSLKKGEYVFGVMDKSASVQPVIQELRKLIVFPNPSQGIIRIKFPEIHSNGILEVFDSNGRSVYAEEFKKQDSETELRIQSLLKSGTYILVFTDDTGKISNRFIIR